MSELDRGDQPIPHTQRRLSGCVANLKALQLHRTSLEIRHLVVQELKNLELDDSHLMKKNKDKQSDTRTKFSPNTSFNKLHKSATLTLCLGPKPKTSTTVSRLEVLLGALWGKGRSPNASSLLWLDANTSKPPWIEDGGRGKRRALHGLEMN